MPGSTSRCWNGAACAWWTGRGRSCARPLRRAGARRSRGDRIGSAAADGGERAGGARRRPSAARPAVDPGWARGRAALARRRLMAARRPACRGGVPGGAARDAARQGGALGDGGQDRSQGRPRRHRPADGRWRRHRRAGTARCTASRRRRRRSGPFRSGASCCRPSGAISSSASAVSCAASGSRWARSARVGSLRSGPLLEGPPSPWRRRAPLATDRPCRWPAAAGGAFAAPGATMPSAPIVGVTAAG